VKRRLREWILGLVSMPLGLFWVRRGQAPPRRRLPDETRAPHRPPNEMTARELQIVRSLLRDDSRIRVFVTRRPSSPLPGADGPGLAAFIGAPYISPLAAMTTFWDLFVFSAHARLFFPGTAPPQTLRRSWNPRRQARRRRGHGHHRFARLRGRPAYTKLFFRGEDSRRHVGALAPDFVDRVRVVGDVVVDQMLEMTPERDLIRRKFGFSGPNRWWRSCPPGDPSPSSDGWEPPSSTK